MPDTPSFARGNYFAESDYLTTDVRTGVMRNRAGTRMLALTDDFLLGLLTALETECGPAARPVLKGCGRHWGRQHGKRLSQELAEYYGSPVTDFPLPMFEACLIEAFAHHGWGKLRFEFDRYAQGIISVAATSAVYASLVGSAKEPADVLLAGVLEGLFSQLTGQDLGCHQTECQAMGAAESRFVLALKERIEKVAKLSGHDTVLAELEKTRT